MQLCGRFGNQQNKQQAGGAVIGGIETYGLAKPDEGGAGLFEVFDAAVLVEAAVRNTILTLRGIDTMGEFIERQGLAIMESGRQN